MKLSESQLKELRPEPSEALVIHTHNDDANIVWILVNGKYLSNQEVEALERDHEIAERVRERKAYLLVPRDKRVCGDLRDETREWSLILDLLGVSEEAQSASCTKGKVTHG